MVLYDALNKIRRLRHHRGRWRPFSVFKNRGSGRRSGSAMRKTKCGIVSTIPSLSAEKKYVQSPTHILYLTSTDLDRLPLSICVSGAVPHLRRRASFCAPMDAAVVLPPVSARQRAACFPPDCVG